MLTNPRSEHVRSVAALATRKARRRTGLFLAEGPQSVREALAHRPSWVQAVYLTDAAGSRHPDVTDALVNAAAPVRRVTDEVMAAMSDTETPQGLLAVCRIPAAPSTETLGAGCRLVCLLANVRDPGNAGTVLRGADAAGADLVVVSGDSVDVWSPKVIRSTAGSIFHVPVVAGIPVAEALDALRGNGLALVAADARGGTALAEADLDRAHAWVLGNEARGLDEAVLGRCDEVVRVPIYGLAESLNLGMAATVCLYASAQVHHQARRDPQSSARPRR